MMLCSLCRNNSGWTAALCRLGEGRFGLTRGHVDGTPGGQQDERGW